MLQLNVTQHNIAWFECPWMHPGLILAWQQCIDISIEPFSAYPRRVPIVEHGVLKLMDVQWQQNKQQSWLVTLTAGWRHANPWHHLKEQEKEGKKVKSSLFFAKRGYWVQNSQARREEWDYLIHRMSQIFPRRQCQDESRCCCFCMECWSTWQDVMFSLCPHVYIVQLVTCELWFSQLVTKFACTVYCQASKTTPALPGLSRCLEAPNPHPHQPPPTPVLQRKGPHPKFGRRHQMVVVFVLLTLSFSLSFHVPVTCQVNIQVILL